MESNKQEFGPEHPNFLSSIGNLALTYLHQGRLQEAEKLGIEAMGVYEQTLRLNHPNTLAIMGNLASIYWKQGRCEEAENLGMQVNGLCTQLLGTKHPDTLTSINNLAHMLRSSGQDEAALKMMIKCVEHRHQQLAPDHPEYLSSMSSLSKWHEIGDFSTSQDSEVPIEPEEGRNAQNTSPEALARVPRTSQHSTRATISRLFHRT